MQDITKNQTVDILCTLISNGILDEYVNARSSLPSSWDSNTLGDGDSRTTGGKRNIVLCLVQKIVNLTKYSSGQNAYQAKAYVKHIESIVSEKGVPNEKIWKEALTTLYETGDWPGRQKLLSFWRGIAPVSYFKDLDSLVALSVKKRLYVETDALIVAGGSVNAKMEQMNYEWFGNIQRGPEPLIAYVESVEALELMERHGVNVNIKVMGVDLLEWTERRSNSDFLTGERRAVTAKIKSMIEKSLENELPEMKEKRAQEALWKTVINAKSWVDVKIALETTPKWDSMRGKNGENLLQHMVINKPSYFQNLLKIKGGKALMDKEDAFGANMTHYLGFANKLPSMSVTPWDSICPETLSDWIVWQEKMWKIQDVIGREDQKDHKLFNLCWTIDETARSADILLGENARAKQSFGEFKKYLKSVDGFRYLAKNLYPILKQADNANFQTHLFDFKKLLSKKLSEDEVMFGLIGSVENLFTLDDETQGYKQVKEWIERGASWNKLLDSKIFNEYAETLPKRIKETFSLSFNEVNNAFQGFELMRAANLKSLSSEKPKTLAL